MCYAVSLIVGDLAVLHKRRSHQEPNTTVRSYNGPTMGLIEEVAAHQIPAVLISVESIACMGTRAMEASCRQCMKDSAQVARSTGWSSNLSCPKH